MSNLSAISSPHLLHSNHYLESFDCGVDVLNEYLKKYALQNQLAQGARSYVTTRNSDVVGYFTLAYGSISREIAPQRLQQGLGRYPIPILVLARLAVDLSEKGKDLGKALLKEACLKALNASEIAGLRAIVVHAKEESSKKFYQNYGFQSFASDELCLYLLLKDLRKNIFTMSQKTVMSETLV